MVTVSVQGFSKTGLIESVCFFSGNSHTLAVSFTTSKALSCSHPLWVVVFFIFILGTSDTVMSTVLHGELEITNRVAQHSCVNIGTLHALVQVMDFVPVYSSAYTSMRETGEDCVVVSHRKTEVGINCHFWRS